MKLVLFDIDGTLLLTGGATRRSMLAAGRACFGPAFEWHPVTIGQLDPQLLRELLHQNGLSPTDADFAAFQRCYVETLASELTRAGDAVRVFPGVRELLDVLRPRRDAGEALTGILTGNLRAVTTAKLAAAQLDTELFDLQLCGEDAPTRPGLASRALEFASRHSGTTVHPCDAIVIGDTPRDVECAHAIGCVAIAVATGHFDAATLGEAGADLVVTSLADRAGLATVMGDLL